MSRRTGRAGAAASTRAARRSRAAQRRRSGGPDLSFPTTETLTYQRPELPAIGDIARYYALSEEARYYSNGGPCHQQLSARLKTYVGGTAASCLPVSNCTLGLIVALRAVCGEPAVGQAPLVAVPSFTFTATACAIRWAGFRPLFVDIEEDSWQLDPDALDNALERHAGEIVGVLGCSTFGSAPPTATRERWRTACVRHGLPLLIDSAAGFGAVDEADRRLGGLGETEIFSFHATKPFAIGEGGLIVTADSDLAESLGRIVNFGLHPVERVSLTAGINAKLSELQCATALAMLDRYDDVLARRRETARRLQERLADYPLTFQLGSEGSTWQVFQVLMADPISRDRALTAAARRHVEVRTCFDPPVHLHPAFAADPRAGGLPVTERLAARALSLPLANTLGERQMSRLQQMLDDAVGPGR
jgi:dTDP-4-amino-4,6-dideoxygalactose transaminase